jgi:uncharacterized protein
MKDELQSRNLELHPASEAPSMKKKSGSLHSRLSTYFDPRDFVNRIKHLNGDPHEVALGMAIGIFIGVTPTIPLHTVLAVLLAFVFRCSKAAAMIGVWISNPVTIPVFYLGSYKVGAFILGNSMPFDLKYDSIVELAKVGLDVTLAMLLGGVVIGVPPAVAFYYITKRLATHYRLKKEWKDP